MNEKMESPLIVEDHDHYVKSFKAFSAACAKFKDDAFDQWTDDIFGGKIVPEIRATRSEQEQLRVLGVGSGSGVLDCRMLKKLLPRFPSINNRVVEPLQGQVDQFKSLAQSKSRQLQGVTFDWRLQTIEQYMKAGDLTKFHLISAVHSLYYVDDVESKLMYLQDLLEPGGVLLIITNSDTSGHTRFRNRFKPFHDRNQDLNSNSAAAAGDIRSALDRRGISYKVYTQPTYMDVTECLDETSEEGALLVDFITHVANFKQTVSGDFYGRMIEYLGSSDCSVRSGGEIHLSIDFDTIVINKPK